MAKQHQALVPSISGHLPLLGQGGEGVQLPSGAQPSRRPRFLLPTQSEKHTMAELSATSRHHSELVTSNDRMPVSRGYTGAMHPALHSPSAHCTVPSHAPSRPQSPQQTASLFIHRMSSSFVASAQNAMGTLWQTYRFKDPEYEAQYLRRHRTSLVRVTQVWCVSRLAFELLVFLGAYFQGLPLHTLFSFVPNIAVVLGGLLAVSLRSKYTIQIVSVVVAAMMVSASGAIHLNARAVLSELETSCVLREVYAALQDTHPEVVARLHAFVSRYCSAAIIGSQIILCIPQLLLLVYLGLYKSTALATMAMPVIFAVGVCFHPDLALDVAVILAALFFCITMFLLGVLPRQSWLLRCAFFSERSFEVVVPPPPQPSLPFLLPQPVYCIRSPKDSCIVYEFRAAAPLTNQSGVPSGRV